MTKGLLLTAGLIAFVGTTAGSALAQDCPSLLKWSCPDTAQTNTVNQVTQPGQRQSITRTGSAPAVDPVRQPQTQVAPDVRQQAEQPQVTRAARTGKNSRYAYKSRKHSAQRIARADACAEMTAQEKAAFFKEILAWQNERQSGPQTNKE